MIDILIFIRQTTYDLLDFCIALLTICNFQAKNYGNYLFRFVFYLKIRLKYFYT